MTSLIPGHLRSGIRIPGPEGSGPGLTRFHDQLAMDQDLGLVQVQLQPQYLGPRICMSKLKTYSHGQVLCGRGAREVTVVSGLTSQQSVTLVPQARGRIRTYLFNSIIQRGILLIIVPENFNSK